MAITLLSPLNNVFRRDVAVDASDLTDPTDANCLIAGQWVNIDSNGNAADQPISAHSSQTPAMYQVFTDKGDYSAQALGKVTILNSFDYIAETDQYTASPTISVGSYLAVHTDGTLIATTTNKDLVVAIALAAPTSAGILKYQRVSPFRYLA
jgi:hypothetical protein